MEHSITIEKQSLFKNWLGFRNGVPDLPEHSVGHYFHQDPFEAQPHYLYCCCCYLVPDLFAPYIY